MLGRVSMRLTDPQPRALACGLVGGCVCPSQPGSTRRCLVTLPGRKETDLDRADAVAWRDALGEPQCAAHRDWLWLRVESPVVQGEGEALTHSLTRALSPFPFREKRAPVAPWDCPARRSVLGPAGWLWGLAASAGLSL